MTAASRHRVETTRRGHRPRRRSLLKPAMALLAMLLATTGLTLAAPTPAWAVNPR